MVVEIILFGHGFSFETQLLLTEPELRCATRCKRATQPPFGTLPSWVFANLACTFATSFSVMGLALVGLAGLGRADLDIAISFCGD